MRSQACSNGVFLVWCCAVLGAQSLRLDPRGNLGAFAALLRGKRDAFVAECGVRGPTYETLIAGGEDASPGEFPWHAGIYRFVVNKPRVQDCGGTLLTRSLVVTAAHCFWEESTKVLNPVTFYKIALGKHLREWEQQEHGLQTRDVAEINIPKRYRGRGSQFQYDIAVVKLSAKVDFTVTVSPICMDWSKLYEDQQLSPETNGIATGWGVTSSDKIADVLQKVELPFVDFDTCFDALPENAKSLYTDDKFCAGFANKSRSVCRGDSGGGLVFIGANDRYFLRGVVSVSFKPESNRDPCYSQLYTGFTLVSQYLPWIKTFVDEEEGASASVATTEPQWIISIGEMACEHYSSAVYDKEELPSSAPIKVSTCAMSPSGVNPLRLLSQPKEFPHVGGLGYLKDGEVNWFCIGNLISERYLITAGHCTDPVAGVLKWVRLGSVKLYANNTDQGLVHLEVDEVIRHPAFKSPSLYNDIALVRLKENVEFNGFVRPACLDSNPSALGNGIVTAASWGKTEFDSDVYDGLLNGDARVVDTASCNQSYANRSRTLANGISAETQLCVKTLDHSTDCALLSGSPIMVKLTKPFCMYRIAGIISFGSAQCGTADAIPGVATRVSAFVPWIESVVWPGEKSALSKFMQFPDNISFSKESQF